MEWLFAAFGLLISAYIIFMWIKFTAFKSELMNELGRHGVPYGEAENLYTHLRDQVHKLRGNGLTTAEIAEKLSNSLKRARASQLLSLSDEQQDIDANLEKARSLVLYISGALEPQFIVLKGPDGSLP
ncbi:MAG: hypothetical protein K5905_24280, partial [Roseibium sp.]|uniref:hypothetical protein n=1 Tax=Roseibium sp. TaxID=1936156 RepID=UPI0026275709